MRTPCPFTTRWQSGSCRRRALSNEGPDERNYYRADWDSCLLSIRASLGPS
jgi:hypothetical protein